MTGLGPACRRPAICCCPPQATAQQLQLEAEGLRAELARVQEEHRTVCAQYDERQCELQDALAAEQKAKTLAVTAEVKTREAAVAAEAKQTCAARDEAKTLQQELATLRTELEELQERRLEECAGANPTDDSPPPVPRPPLALACTDAWAAQTLGRARVREITSLL